MTGVTIARWKEAQSAEAHYWQGLSVMELLRISAEKPIFLFVLGAERCAALFDGKDVLEIGTGPIGLSLASFYRHKDRIRNLVKIDPLPRMQLSETRLKEEIWAKPFIDWADSLTNEGEYRQSSGEELDLAENFDCVIIYNVLDHVRDPQRILMNAYRSLRPGGRLVVGVDCLSVIGRLKFEYYIRLACKGSVLAEAHPHTFLPKNVCRMMENAEFKDVTTYGIKGWLHRLIGGATRPGFIGMK